MSNHDVIAIDNGAARELGFSRRGGAGSARVYAVAIAVLLLSVTVPARAQTGCAGDGEPYDWLAPSGLVALGMVPWAGPDAALVDGDLIGGTGINFRTVRVALCGRIETRRGRLVYNLGYEPWNVLERARPDAQSWGRLLAAEIGFAPWRWLTISLGVRKLAFSFGHDEPEGELELPTRPWLPTSITPDRRLGVTLDADLGAARVRLGAYEGAYDLVPTLPGGLVVALRLVAEPLGPVGLTISTVHDNPGWRRRARFGVNASVLLRYASDGTGYALGFDVPFKWGPLGLVAEYLFATGLDEQGPSRLPVPRLQRQGVWAQAALMLWRPYVELEARYQWVDVPGYLRFRYQDATVGLTGYFLRAIIRVQVAYDHKFHAEPGWHDDGLLLLLSASY